MCMADTARRRRLVAEDGEPVDHARPGRIARFGHEATLVARVAGTSMRRLVSMAFSAKSARRNQSPRDRGPPIKSAAPRPSRTGARVVCCGSPPSRRYHPSFAVARPLTGQRRRAAGRDASRSCGPGSRPHSRAAQRELVVDVTGNVGGEHDRASTATGARRARPGAGHNERKRQRRKAPG